MKIYILKNKHSDRQFETIQKDLKTLNRKFPKYMYDLLLIITKKQKQ